MDSSELSSVKGNSMVLLSKTSGSTLNPMYFSSGSEFWVSKFKNKNVLRRRVATIMSLDCNFMTLSILFYNRFRRNRNYFWGCFWYGCRLGCGFWCNFRSWFGGRAWCRCRLKCNLGGWLNYRRCRTWC